MTLGKEGVRSPDVALPLGEGTLTRDLGLDVVVVVTKVCGLFSGKCVPVKKIFLAFCTACNMLCSTF